MHMDYVTGRIGKTIRTALPSVITVALASCVVYGIYTGNIDAVKEMGRAAALGAGIGAGVVGSVSDLYSLRNSGDL